MAKFEISQRSGATNLIQNKGAVKTEQGYEIEIKNLNQLIELVQAGSIAISPSRDEKNKPTIRLAYTTN
jgi:hypothetical protein